MDHNIFQDIDWDLQHKALSTFAHPDQRRILKFIHSWFPTNKRLFHKGIESSPKCNLCNHLEESTEHLLTCSHDSLESIWLQLTALFLWKDTNNHGNAELNNIIAITESPHIDKWSPVIADTSPESRI
jgi:hypothetical protein